MNYDKNATTVSSAVGVTPERAEQITHQFEAGIEDLQSLHPEGVSGDKILELAVSLPQTTEEGFWLGVVTNEYMRQWEQNELINKLLTGNKR